MTNDIEVKALALVNEVNVERGYTPYSKFDRDFDHTSEALCRAIEQHEAFKQEVSDALVEYFGPKHLDVILAGHLLECFIIPKPKSDPLAQTLGDFDGTLWEPEDVDRFRAALEARGLEIREKGQ